ncbi:alpha-amylase-like [Daphnia carinata]|uniref:alpha-amylase-like n=1 Tax=Daphnia carinata TaxID=120202 RepID=UPI00257A5574|nr:alpha-amylase-like [Daphnia carinata]
MLLHLLLVANIGWLVLVAGQNEIPTVPCYGSDCLVTELTTEMTTSPTTESTTTPTTTPRPAGIQRTVVVIYKVTELGQDMFIQGGVNKETVRPSCATDVSAETSQCSISINATALGTGTHWAKYDAWRVGDTKLDWFGVQPGQGIYQTYVAYGTPLAWTTNVPGTNGYQQLNTWGPNNWMVDFQMNCDETENGWFDVHAYLTLYGTGYEPDIQQSVCSGTGSDVAPPYISNKNHVACCGYINRFNFGTGGCEINGFP